MAIYIFPENQKKGSRPFNISEYNYQNDYREEII